MSGEMSVFLAAYHPYLPSEHVVEHMEKFNMPIDMSINIYL